MSDSGCGGKVPPGRSVLEDVAADVLENPGRFDVVLRATVSMVLNRAHANREELPVFAAEINIGEELAANQVRDAFVRAARSARRS